MMRTVKNELLTLHIKINNNCCLVINKHFGCTRFVFDESNVEENDYPKEKITVVKRKFFNDKQTSTAIEWKSAADVIKKLNYENKYLFGPVLTSKYNSLDHSKNHNYSEIIQHETRLPIVEPAVHDGSLQSDATACRQISKLDLQSILTFPLLNKFVHSTKKINEVNYLRKQLEYLCQKSFVPSVSMILQKTMPTERVEILDRWRQNMITQLGKEGFEKYQAELFANGSSLHHSISSFLSSVPKSELHVKEENIGHWKSLSHILPHVKEVKLLEEIIAHPFLCYKGIVDCFAKYKDDLVVIDWKTSKKAKPLIKNTYDDPLQIAAYVGALNFDPKFQYLANKGLIVIAYENGHPATAHSIDESSMKFYWNEWLMRIKQFWELKVEERENS